MYYPRNHPLPTIIQACNGWMPGMTAVLEQWTEIGESISKFYYFYGALTTRHRRAFSHVRIQTQLPRLISLTQARVTVAKFRLARYRFFRTSRLLPSFSRVLVLPHCSTAANSTIGITRIHLTSYGCCPSCFRQQALYSVSLRFTGILRVSEGHQRTLIGL